MHREDMDTAWPARRDAAGLPRFRFHDLRHTVITELAELGVADHVLESISGHLSRRRLEQYSHILIDAKGQALDAMDQERRGDAGRMEMAATVTPTGTARAQTPNNGEEIPLLDARSEGLASQSAVEQLSAVR